MSKSDEYKKIVSKGKGGSDIFNTTNGADSRFESVKYVGKKSGRTEAENALYAANMEAVKSAAEARVKARNHNNGMSAEGAPFDKDHERASFQTESMRQLDASQAKESGMQSKSRGKAITAQGKGSTVFSSAAQNILKDTRGDAIDGASPKKFVKKAGRTEAEDALYAANMNAVKTAAEARVKAKNHINATSAEGVLYDKEHEKTSFETESMRQLTSKEQNAAISEQHRKAAIAQRQRGFASEVFSGGSYEQESSGSEQKITDRPMQGSYVPASQMADQSANHAKRQALLAGNGPLW